MIKQRHESSRTYAEVFGLFVALVLTTLFWWPSIASRLFPEDLVWRNVAAQAADWGFALILMVILVWWERRPLSSLGFKPLRLTNFCAGLGLGGFFMLGVVLWVYLISPLVPGLREQGLDSGGSSAALPRQFFLWYAPFAWITASFCEEVVYRGYAMERLLSVTETPGLLCCSRT